jgi:hypothetical protein
VTDQLEARRTVALFIQCQQPDGTWETASSAMDAQNRGDEDYAIERLERRRRMMPQFPFRLVRRTTTTTTEQEALDV